MGETDAFVELIAQKAAERTVELLRKEKMLAGKENRQDTARPRVAHSIKELADYLGRSPGTVSSWKKKKKLEGCYIQLDRSITFNLDQVDKRLGRKDGSQG